MISVALLGSIASSDAWRHVLTEQLTQNAAVLEAIFTPDGDYSTMLFIICPAECPEQANSDVSNGFGVWVNIAWGPSTAAPDAVMSIVTVNRPTNPNLCFDNTAGANA